MRHPGRQILGFDYAFRAGQHRGWLAALFRLRPAPRAAKRGAVVGVERVIIEGAGGARLPVDA